MALGVMGLEHHYFYSLTPRVFSNISKGFNQRKESEEITSWTQTRKMMFAVLKPHLKNKNATEKDLFVFPWENKTEEDSEFLTENQAEEILKKQKEFWKKIDNKKKK